MDATSVATIVGALIAAAGAIVAARIGRGGSGSAVRLPTDSRDSRDGGAGPSAAPPAVRRPDNPRRVAEVVKPDASARPAVRETDQGSAGPASPRPGETAHRRVVVEDVTGVRTELSGYAIVYNPYGRSDPSFFGSRKGLILKRGVSTETLSWDKVRKVEITERSPSPRARLILTTGVEIRDAELVPGSFWGKTDSGTELLIALGDLHSIEPVH